MSQESRLFIGLVICCQIIWIKGHCEYDSVYYIKHAGSPLVLEAKENKVTMQAFDGSDGQLWQFKGGDRPGFFVITSKSTGKVLDFIGNELTTSKEDGSLNQQWTLEFNGRLVNAGARKVLDISGGRFEVNNHLQLWDDNGTISQKFEVMKKSW